MKKIIASLFTVILFVGFTSHAQDIAIGEIAIGTDDNPKIMGSTLNVTVKLEAPNGHVADGSEFSIRIFGTGFTNFESVMPTVDLPNPAIVWTYSATFGWTGITSGSFLSLYLATVTFENLVVGSAGTTNVSIVANLTPYASDTNNGNDGNTKSIPVMAPTPVDLISFNGKAEGGTAVLDWSTAEETGFSHFVVEKSADAIAFSAIGEVVAKGSGNDYDFSTPQTEALVYYRLTMVDVDGTSAVSKIIPVALDDSQTPVFMVYPNPTADYLQVKFNEDGVVRIVDISGNAIKTQKVEAGVSVIDVQHLREGVYYGKLNNQSFKFVKK